MKRQLLTLSALALLIVLTGCNSTKPQCTTMQLGMPQSISDLIDVTDGISQQEANTISFTYFLNYLSVNGNLSAPLDNGDCWITTCQVGINKIAMKYPIIIDKVTGKTYMEGYPEVSYPYEYEDVIELCSSAPLL